jgi:hypothetical protein
MAMPGESPAGLLAASAMGVTLSLEYFSGEHGGSIAWTSARTRTTG